MELSGLTQLCGNNIPGIRNLKYTPIANIDRSLWGTVNMSHYVMRSEPPFLSGKAWLTAPVIIGRNAYTETPSKDNAGNYNTCNLSVFLPFDTEDIIKELGLMTSHYFIVEWTDSNNRKWVLGDIFQPCEFISPFDGGSSLGTSKGYTLTWTCKTSFARRHRSG